MGGSNSRPVAPPPTPPKVETPAVTPRDRAILQVKVQRDRIQQHQRKVFKLYQLFSFILNRLIRL